MSKEDVVKIDGEISEVCKAGLFKVMADNGAEITCHLSGKMRMNGIKLVAGDKVQVELSPYDLTKGRIVYRNR